MYYPLLPSSMVLPHPPIPSPTHTSVPGSMEYVAVEINHSIGDAYRYLSGLVRGGEGGGRWGWRGKGKGWRGKKKGGGREGGGFMP
jgi:hypothetical protein